MNQKSYKHIVVSEELFEKLRELGRTGESFNDVLKKLVGEK
ncbi:MAG: hypothetical protein HOD60_05545 [Candidatus Nitrosopelagicus sp.]|jgi:predicted CopG family antitoxin|nr:hypothetical protein [Candidatus Nitrosopelagicus sp.]